MGLRDNMKKAVGTVAAGIRSALHAPRGVLQARSAIRVTATDASLRAVPIPASFALAPSAARAMDSGVITQPRLVLPSQEAFMQRPEVLMSEPDPIHIRVVKSPIFQGSVGIVAAGAAGAAIYQQVQKKQTESMRSMLSSTAGIDLDASILDEVQLTQSVCAPALKDCCICVHTRRGRRHSPLVDIHTYAHIRYSHAIHTFLHVCVCVCVRVYMCVCSCVVSGKTCTSA